jgi:hypothetical protein
MIGLLKAAVAGFGGFGFTTKALIAVAFAATVALTVTSVYEFWHHQVFKSGYERALLDVARADDKTVDRASKMRNAWVACRDAGRPWDQTTGSCK